jgi:hypothetical protein
MLVTINRERTRVLLTGNGYEIQLTWSQAALLATLLNEKSREIEPARPPGKVYRPAVERDG